MPKIEIDESELANLQNIARFADAAMKDPKTRHKMLEIDKTLNPNKAIPELDAPTAVMAELTKVTESVAALSKKIDDDRSKREEEERTRVLSRKVTDGQAMLAKAGYTKEGIDKIEALMLEEGIASYSAGLAFYEKLNPRPTPTESSASRWGSMSDVPLDQTAPDFKQLWESQGKGGEADAWVNKVAADTLRGMRH